VFLNTRHNVCPAAWAEAFSDTAINTGYYTFTYVKDGESKSVPARSSFVYAKRNGRWMIVDHHSSAMPVLPK
jgi:hypothetical protein